MGRQLIFDTHENEKQKECVKTWFDNTITDIAYGGAKGGAKSYTGCGVIFSDAFMYPETNYFIARKKLNDLRKFTIPSIHEVFDHFKITSGEYRYDGKDSFFQIYNGSKIFLIEAAYMPSDHLYQRFGSMQMTRGWIEEAGEFDLSARNSLKATVGRWKNDVYNINGKVLETLNPSKNYVYSEFYKPWKTGTLSHWKKFIQALPSDNKKLSKDYIENLMRTLTKNERERLIFGNWEYDDNPNALCDYENITAMFNNDQVVEEGKKYITADIARLGSDKAIVAVWHGWVLIEVHIFEKSLMTQIQDCIVTMRNKHKIPNHNCIADEDGIGGGVVDNCKIKGFVNNSRPVEEKGLQGPEKKNYYNLQSQCLFKFAERINSNKIYLKVDLQQKHKEEIVQEMETIEAYGTEVDGKLRIIPKEKVKDKIGRSPDWRDVLMMREYFDLAPEVFMPKLSF